MANKEVNVTKRVKTASGFRYCPVVLSSNGRIKPNYVYANGREEYHPEGSYYIEWYEGERRIRQSVGKNAADATARRMRQQQILASKILGIRVVEDSAPSEGYLLADAVHDFLEEKRLHRKKKTYQDHRAALDYFLKSCTKQRLAEVDRKDLLAFVAHLRNTEKLHPRTVYNKFARVTSFLKTHGIKVHLNGDSPKYVEETPEVYEKAELDQFFRACTPEERIYFEFFLKTGMREQEVMYAHLSDINFARGTVTVRQKPQYGFTPKNYKGREIPIPNKLGESLKKWKAQRKDNSPLLFPTAAGRPKQDFLDICKRIASRASLDENDFWLHKFRATFATWHLRNAVDLRTVQAWMGHTDIESTMRYLRPAEAKESQDKVNTTFAD